MVYRVCTYGLSPLEVTGLRSSLEKWEVTADEDIISVEADAYIITAEKYVQHVDYFYHNRAKTIIYNDNPIDELRQRLDNIVNDNCVNINQKNLSIREKEVLKEIATGKTSKEIADKLCISVNTVVTHRKNISAKLGIRSASGLSLYALMNGII